MKTQQKSRFDVHFDNALKAVKAEWKQYCEGGHFDDIYVVSKCEQMIAMAKQIRDNNHRLKI